MVRSGRGGSVQGTPASQVALAPTRPVGSVPGGAGALTSTGQNDRYDDVNSNGVDWQRRVGRTLRLFGTMHVRTILPGRPAT